MKIAIFGLGYVGCVGVGCLSDFDHEVIGVDVDPIKVALINSGKATIVEKDIDELIKKNFDKGLIKATTNSSEATMNSEVAIICVGTPNDQNGHLDMSHIYAVAREVGKTIKTKNTFYHVAIRSTVMPGTNRKVAEIIEEESGKKNIKDFAVVSNPEFLREGTAVKDFFQPPYTVLASDSREGIDIMEKVYKKLNAEIVVVSIGVAELIKFVNNSFHALKVAFSNEIGRLCKNLGVDSHVLMELFIKDKLLNISPAYLIPGFAYGGSCLPKDLKAINTIAHDKYISVPILSSISESNQDHIDFAFHQITSKNIRDIGFLGITFKPETDDLRFSPALELVERLLGKGFNIKIYDNNINISRLTGKNKDYLFLKLPHINKVLVENFEVFLQKATLIVVPNKIENLEKVIENKNKFVFDLSRCVYMESFENYEGLCW